MRKREHDMQHKIEEEKSAPKSMLSHGLLLSYRGALEDEEVHECRVQGPSLRNVLLNHF